MWEIQSPVKTQTLPRTNPVRYSEKYGSVSVKSNYRSYRDFLQSFNENKTSPKDDQESISSVDSGISSYKLSECKSNNNSSSSLNSEYNSITNNSHSRRTDISGLKTSFGSYKEFLENYNNKKFSSVKPTLPVKKSVKSEIFIQVGDDEIKNKTSTHRSEDQTDCSKANGMLSPITNLQANEKMSPASNGHVHGKISPVNGRSNGSLSPINKFKDDKYYIEKPPSGETCKRLNGCTNSKATETIKRFNELSKGQKNSCVVNGNINKIKSRISNGKPDVVPERSSFINGRTSPMNVPTKEGSDDQDFKQSNNVKTRKFSLNGTSTFSTDDNADDQIAFKFNGNLKRKLSLNSIPTTENTDEQVTKIPNGIANGKTTSGNILKESELKKPPLMPKTFIGKPSIHKELKTKAETVNGTDIGQSGYDHIKISANVKQISEELNRLNIRLLNGEVTRPNGSNKEVTETKTSTESLNDCPMEEPKSQDQEATEHKVIDREGSQSPAIPPPPPPPPLFNLDTSTSIIPRKWATVKTESENSNSGESPKPKGTNQAAMDLAKILTESRKLRKTKSVDDALECESATKESINRKTPSPRLIKVSNDFIMSNANSKPNSLESLTDQPQSLPYSSLTLTHVSNASNRHNNYRENNERTPSPPKQDDAQPLKSTYNGKTCAKVSVMPNSLQRTMSAPKNDGSSILEANAKTVVPVTDKNAKIEKGDPNVKKLVYSTYRGLLGAYNNKANDIIATLPRNMVREDQGVTKQLESIALQGGLEKLNGRINPNPDKD